MRIFVFIFIVVLASVLFFANFAFYSTFLKFFQITSLVWKRALVSGCLLLTIGFIVTSILTRFYAGWPVKILYIGSATWIGALLYFLIACGLAWLVYILAKQFGFSPDMKSVLAVFLGVALLVTAYGMIINERLRMVKLTATIENLPPAWQGKTIAHISDLHLGVIHGAAHAKKVVEKVNSLKPDMVIITGDYFDGTSPDYETLARPLEGLVADDGVYFVNGNHETYLDTVKAWSALSAAGVRPLSDEIVKLNGLNIIGADYPARGISRDLSPLFRQIDPDGSNILLYHEPRYLAEAKTAGIDLMLTGHTHAGQLWPIRHIDRLIYGKYYYGWHQDGDFAIYTTSGAGSWGPPLRVGTNSEIALITLVSK